MNEPKQTQLYLKHTQLNAKIVDFGGWALPVNYGSQIDEHHAVRNDCGMFDVSHMTVTDITGKQTLSFLSFLLANDVAKVARVPGKAMYSCMLNETGGVIDDLIVYYINDKHCRLVSNAATNQKVMAWLQTQALSFSVEVNEKPELALLAVQGPNAINYVKSVLDQQFAQKLGKLSRFQGLFHEEHFIGRTGYTGEDGVELIANGNFIGEIWDDLLKKGVQPCGLGARDTLRLEAGMALYGNDLDENHSPFDSGLNWTVNLNNREFIGKAALHPPAKFSMIGLILEDRGVLREHQKIVLDDLTIGEVTSGTFSPTLGKSIALARVKSTHKPALNDTLKIAVRKKMLDARVVKYPFI